MYDLDYSEVKEAFWGKFGFQQVEKFTYCSNIQATKMIFKK
jgi:hypothetical protein